MNVSTELRFALFLGLGGAVFVDGGEVPANKKIYYHYGLDSGGAEGMVDIVAAAAGRVISSGKEMLPGYDDSPVKPRYDVVYLLDDRGWYYRYSHLQTIDPALRPGAKVILGQKVGVLGKEGGSGGWSHLHFDITSRQPSGQWGIQEGYAFLWEACQRQFAPKLVAVFGAWIAANKPNDVPNAVIATIPPMIGSGLDSGVSLFVCSMPGDNGVRPGTVPAD